MIFIAHRGLTDGPNSQKENSPNQIDLALKEGFYVEFDMWVYLDNFWLGHGQPTIFMTDEIKSQIFPNAYKLLIHAKNTDLVDLLSQIDLKEKYINYFYHDKDALTFSNTGWLIENINRPNPASNSFINQPELHDFFHDDSHLNVNSCERFLQKYGMNAAGVITKYPRMFKEAWNRIQTPKTGQRIEIEPEYLW